MYSILVVTILWTNKFNVLRLSGRKEDTFQETANLPPHIRSSLSSSYKARPIQRLSSTWTPVYVVLKTKS